MATSTKMEPYKERIKYITELAHSSSIVTARSDFNEFINSFLKTAKTKLAKDAGLSEASPNAIDELIKSYTDRFERLKFLFLEQESKEQFLRLILDPDSKLIDREEIIKAVEKGEKLKQVLADKKGEIDSLTSQIDSKARVSQEYLEDIEFKKENLLNLIFETFEKNAYLDKVYNTVMDFNSKDPSVSLLEKLKEKNLQIDFNLEDLSNEQLLEKIKETKLKRENVQAKMRGLEQDKDFKITKIKNDLKRSKNLVSETEKLTREVEQIKALERLQDEEETFRTQKQELLRSSGQVSVLIDLFSKLANIYAFSFNNTENEISFKFKDYQDAICTIKISQSSRIADIKYSLLEKSVLDGVMEDSNGRKNPAFEAVNSIYKVLKQDAKYL